MAAIAAKIAEAEGRRSAARINPRTGQQEFAIEEITVTGRGPSRSNIGRSGREFGVSPFVSLPDGDAFAIRFQNSRAAFLNGLIAQGYKLSPDGKTLIGPNGEVVEVEPVAIEANQPPQTPPPSLGSGPNQSWIDELPKGDLNIDPKMERDPLDACTPGDRRDIEPLANEIQQLEELEKLLASKYDEFRNLLDMPSALHRWESDTQRQERMVAQQQIAQIASQLGFVRSNLNRLKLMASQLETKCPPITA